MGVHPNSLANLQPGRKPGARNRVKLPTLQEVVKPAHVRKAWARLVKLIGDEDAGVALRAAAKVLEYAVGRPALLVEGQLRVDHRPTEMTDAEVEAILKRIEGEPDE